MIASIHALRNRTSVADITSSNHRDGWGEKAITNLVQISLNRLKFVSEQEINIWMINSGGMPGKSKVIKLRSNANGNQDEAALEKLLPLWLVNYSIFPRPALQEQKKDLVPGA